MNTAAHNVANVSTGSQLTLSKHYVEEVTKLHTVSRFFNAGQHGNQGAQCWNFFGFLFYDTISTERDAMRTADRWQT